MRSVKRERLRVPAPQRSGRMPFAGLSLEVSSLLRYVIFTAEPLTMLALPPCSCTRRSRRSLRWAVRRFSRLPCARSR